MKLLAFMVVCLVISGCIATQQQYRPTAADDPSTKCFIGMDIDPRFQALIPKLGSVSRADRATIEILANAQKATDEDKATLSLWGVSRRECADMGKSFRNAYAPSGFAALYDVQQNKMLQEIAKLYAGDITYGQFANERQKLANESSTKYQEIDSREKAARTQQATENQTRADIALQMMIQKQQFQQQQQRSMPTTTNCNRFGSQMTCTTQ